MAVGRFAINAGWPRGRTGGPFGLSVLRGSMVVVLAALCAGLLTVVVGQLDLKMLIVLGGVLGITLGLLTIRQRPLAVLLLLVLALQVMFHKSFGPIITTTVSGPQSINVMTTDVITFVLFGLWATEGTLVRELRGLLRRPEFLIPVLGIAALLPSVLVAHEVRLAFSEILRLVMSFALYVYVALRVRTRREVGFIVAAFFIVAAVQCALVLLQERVGGSLGLDVLGEEESLEVRTVEDTEIPRPSGTVIHPVFLGALLSPIGLLGLSLLINLRRSVWKLLCLPATLAAFVPLFISQTRGSTLGVTSAVFVMCSWYLWRGRLPWRTVVGAFVAVACAAFLFRDAIATRISNNIGTEHFWLEVDVRMELNGVAVAMMRDHPILGVGLNNFQQVLPRYDLYGLGFPDNPVHNMYLLIFSETGVIGFVGFIATLVVLAQQAIRLSRARDRLLGGVGVALTATFLFFAIEELLMFALRHDMPRTIFWFLAGLGVACLRISQRQTRTNGGGPAVAH